MASEDVVGKRSETAVSTIVNLAEEAKLAREGVKAPSYRKWKKKMIYRKWSLLTGPTSILGGIVATVVVANIIYDQFPKEPKEKQEPPPSTN